METNNKTATPSSPPPAGGAEPAGIFEKFEQLIAEEAEDYARKIYGCTAKDEKANIGRLWAVAKPQRRRRYVGQLLTIGDYRREMGALYKEAYYGNINWEDLTRATYALGCMMRAAVVEKMSVKGKRDAGN